MGLITRCPACGTMFKVVADQLKISEGWVRCGHCADIFDAAADLRDESQLDLPHGAEPAGHGSESEPLDASSLAEDPSSLQSELQDSALIADEEEIEEEGRALREDPLDRPFHLQREDTSDLEHAGPYGFSHPAPLAPEPEVHDLSFVRQARRRAFWHSPAMRVLLVLLTCVLVATLAAQFAYRERDNLAAAYPEARPWLVRMCASLGCRIGPPRQIDSVAIETSTFNKLRGDTYRLNVTLKNQATNAVAMPALELTLTDAQDQAVVRRVVQPNEFAAGTPALNPRADWSASLVIGVNAGAAGARIAGYRLLAFYP